MNLVAQWALLVGAGAASVLGLVWWYLGDDTVTGVLLFVAVALLLTFKFVEGYE